MAGETRTWKDSLGREYDFVLESFQNEPGPRETMIPHNPMRTRELEIKEGDILIGRPMGMSCGCPITHCGVAMRYYFLPHRCMLQWRHSGLVNFINKSPAGLQIRIEGLYIG